MVCSASPPLGKSGFVLIRDKRLWIILSSSLSNSIHCSATGEACCNADMKTSRTLGLIPSQTESDNSPTSTFVVRMVRINIAKAPSRSAMPFSSPNSAGIQQIFPE
jgi:hypothetical protein